MAAATRLDVLNIPLHIVDYDLRQLVEKHAAVSSVTIDRDLATGRSHGRACLMMKTDADADACVKALDGAMIEGQEIRIRRPAEESGRFGSGMGFGLGIGAFM